MQQFRFTGAYEADAELPDGKMTVVRVKPGDSVEVPDDLSELMLETGVWEKVSSKEAAAAKKAAAAPNNGDDGQVN